MLTIVVLIQELNVKLIIKWLVLGDASVIKIYSLLLFDWILDLFRSVFLFQFHLPIILECGIVALGQIFISCGPLGTIIQTSVS